MLRALRLRPFGPRRTVLPVSRTHSPGRTGHGSRAQDQQWLSVTVDPSLDSDPIRNPDFSFPQRPFFLNVTAWVPGRMSLGRPGLRGISLQSRRPFALSIDKLPRVASFHPDTTDPFMAMKLEPDFGPNSVNLPPLPVIRDARIREQVFTHRSLAARPTHVFEDPLEDLSPDNEKYEHLGDTVLGLVVTNLMFEVFPGLRVGPSTKIRSLVVGNSTLADISKKYKLPDRLRLHQAQSITLRASTNVQADVFEAFIGGLFRDQGMGTVQAWLNPLFEPFTQEAYHIVRRQHNLPPLPPSTLTQSLGQSIPKSALDADRSSGAPTIGHLSLFNQHLQRMNRQVEWVYSDGNEPPPPPPPSPPYLPVVSGLDANHAPTSDTDGKAVVLPGEGHSGPGTVQTWYADPGVPSHLRIKGTHTTPVWYVKVLVDGKFFGRGRGNTKKAARNEAAKEGLVRLGIEV